MTKRVKDRWRSIFRNPVTHKAGIVFILRRYRLFLFQKWSVKTYQIPNHPHRQQDHLAAHSLCGIPQGIQAVH